MLRNVLTTALLLEGHSLLVAGFPNMAAAVAKQRLEARGCSLECKHWHAD